MLGVSGFIMGKCRTWCAATFWYGTVGVRYHMCSTLLVRFRGQTVDVLLRWVARVACRSVQAACLVFPAGGVMLWFACRLFVACAGQHVLLFFCGRLGGF